jgi:hypothetical protein
MTDDDFYGCPECGETWASEQGWARHRCGQDQGDLPSPVQAPDVGQVTHDGAYRVSSPIHRAPQRHQDIGPHRHLRGKHLLVLDWLDDVRAGTGTQSWHTHQQAREA